MVYFSPKSAVGSPRGFFTWQSCMPHIQTSHSQSIVGLRAAMMCKTGCEGECGVGGIPTTTLVFQKQISGERLNNLPGVSTFFCGMQSIYSYRDI